MLAVQQVAAHDETVYVAEPKQSRTNKGKKQRSSKQMEQKSVRSRKEDTKIEMDLIHIQYWPQ